MPRILLMIGLVLLSINPTWTQGEANKNLLLAAAMCLSPMVLLIKNTRVLMPRIDLPLAGVAIMVMAMPVLFHPESVRWITMLFTGAWCVFFMMLARLTLISGLRSDEFQKMIRWIVYAYCLVLVVQQICLLTGMPILLNEGAHYARHPWKLNSLSEEPSHATLILSVLMYYYTSTRRAEDCNERLWQTIKETPWLWVAFGWGIFSTVNASAYIFGPLCLLPYITRRNVKMVAAIMIGIVVLMMATPVGNIGQIGRVKRLAVAMITMDEERIIGGDISAAGRIVPSIRGAKSIDPSDPDTYVGHGTDADTRDMGPRPGYPTDKGSAGIFSIWYNYGAICALLFWVVIVQITARREEWSSIVMMLLAIQLSSDYNMQLLWVVLGYAMVQKQILGGTTLLTRWDCQKNFVSL